MTADDFGAAVAVNEAVEIAHCDGILTAASLMMRGAAVDDAVARARAMPGLAVGLHVVLVDGWPVLPRDQVSWLVDGTGAFHGSMLRTALLIAVVPRARAQMRAEVAAQFAAFAATGLRLDHVNAHKHFHLHPMIASAMLAAGARHGLRAMRVPLDNAASAPLRWWARALASRVRRAGLIVNDCVVGLAVSGDFGAARMAAALRDLRSGLTEIYCHPATADVWPGSAPGYRYGQELAALIDPDVCRALADSGAGVGGFLPAIDPPPAGACARPEMRAA